MTERNYYVICDDNCKFEGMTKEEIYDAIAEATGNTPTPVDEAFITKVKEQNAESNLKFWKGTEAEYNALSEKAADTLYIVGTNKVGSLEDIEDAIEDLQEEVQPVIRGGTGATSASDARDNLGLGDAATKDESEILEYVEENIELGDLAREDIAPVSKGGTGATSASDARSNLGAASSYHKHSSSDISGLSNLISVQKQEVTGTLDANSITQLQKDVSRSGYTPLGMIGCSYTGFGDYIINHTIIVPGFNLLNIYMYNTTSSQRSVSVDAYVLYKKN